MQNRLQIISLILVFFYAGLVMAEDSPIYFQIKHQNCILITEPAKTNDKKFNKLFDDALKDRHYKVMNTSKVNPGSLYLLWDRQRHGHGLYKDCSVNLVLKQAKENYKSKSDETLHEKNVRRKYPRISREGDERCRRALKEAFVHIPTCSIPGKN